MCNEEHTIVSKNFHAIASKELYKLIKANCGIETVVLTTEDGFKIEAHSIKDDVDSSKFAALASTLSAISNMSVAETNLGTGYDCTIIESEYSYIIIMGITLKMVPMVLNVIASKEAILGKVLYHANKVVNTLKNKEEL